ncbi:MAG: DEAD/DEAH box helicase [Myxococcota bacterium]
MTTFTLRPYQEEAIEAVLAARRAGVRRMVVCLPTGSGKTVIFSHLASMAKRGVLVLAHREELLTQAKEKLERALGARKRVEIEQGEFRASRDADVIVASLRSLHQERIGRVMQGRDIGLVLYDECHHAPAPANKQVLETMGCFEQDWTGTLVGFTATTGRGDGVGLDTVFQELVYTRTIPEMIDDGYLAPLRGYRVATSADITHLSAAGFDFTPEELGEAIDVEERNALVARTIQELARDRRTIVFCVTVAHAMSLARALNEVGVRAGIVYGEMPREDRQEALKMFREQKLQAITNVGVLTEGFDDPGVSCVAMARPTKSPGLYAQCVGRGTRLFEGKEDCLVLDFVDLSRVELVTLPTLVGMPRGLDLEGEELTEAARQLQMLWHTQPTFEMEPGEITLTEIKARAQRFDPLTMEVDPEIRAISANDWCSLGAKGVALHLFDASGELTTFVVRFAPEFGTRKDYQVLRDDEEAARFRRLEEAVQAVDFEIEGMGRTSVTTARSDASWRLAPVPGDIAEVLGGLTPPRRADTLGEALHYIVYDTYAPRKRQGVWRKNRTSVE